MSINQADLKSISSDKDAPQQIPWTDKNIFNEHDKLVPEAKTYDNSKTVLKLNHPLMIMVQQGRTVRRRC